MKIKNEINYQKLWETLENTISSSIFYWQSLSLIFCFITSFIFYKLLRKFVLPKILASSQKKNVELNRLIVKYLIPVLYPMLAMVLIASGLSIYSQFFKETILFSTTLKLLALFLFLRFLRISSNSNFVANTAGILLMPTLMLDIFDLLDPTAFYLDQYALKIGTVRISIYLVVKAFITLLIVFWFSNLVSKKTKFYINRNKNIKSSTKNILSKSIDVIIYSVIIIIAFKTFSVDMTTVAVIGGAIGVGIGFGLQKIASNFISGIILLLEKSVEIGDVVELENGNIFGIVKHFGGRYTLIECFDGKEIMVPNEDFIISKVSNWTYSNSRARVEINVAVAYKSDLEKVRDIMMACARKNFRCLNYPEIECFVTEFGEFSIKLTLHFWISDIVIGRNIPKGEVMIEILKEFKANKIKIPLPQREVRMKKAKLVS